MSIVKHSTFTELGKKISHRRLHDIFINETIDGKKGLDLTNNTWLEYYTGCNFIMSSSIEYRNIYDPDFMSEFRNEEFDFVVCDQILDDSVSWEMTKNILDNIKRVTRPYGQLFLSFKEGFQGKMIEDEEVHSAKKIYDVLKNVWEIKDKTKVIDTNNNTLFFLNALKC